MDNTKKLPAEGNPPAVGYKEKQTTQHTDRSPLSRGVKGRLIGDAPRITTGRRTGRARPLWTGSKFLAALDALGVEWLGECDLPCSTCGGPALSRPGMVICLGKCLERMRWAGVIDD